MRRGGRVPGADRCRSAAAGIAAVTHPPEAVAADTRRLHRT
jgi:hypothetical protein